MRYDSDHNIPILKHTSCVWSYPNRAGRSRRVVGVGVPLSQLSMASNAGVHLSISVSGQLPIHRSRDRAT